MRRKIITLFWLLLLSHSTWDLGRYVCHIIFIYEGKIVISHAKINLP